MPGSHFDNLPTEPSFRQRAGASADGDPERPGFVPRSASEPLRPTAPATSASAPRAPRPPTEPAVPRPPAPPRPGAPRAHAAPAPAPGLDGLAHQALRLMLRALEATGLLIAPWLARLLPSRARHAINGWSGQAVALLAMTAVLIVWFGIHLMTSAVRLGRAAHAGEQATWALQAPLPTGDTAALQGVQRMRAVLADQTQIIVTSQDPAMTITYRQDGTTLFQAPGQPLRATDRNGHSFRQQAGCWRPAGYTQPLRAASVVLPLAEPTARFAPPQGDQIAFSARRLGSWGPGEGVVTTQNGLPVAYRYREQGGRWHTFTVRYADGLAPLRLGGACVPGQASSASTASGIPSK